jgi:hypothetical protein
MGCPTDGTDSDDTGGTDNLPSVPGGGGGGGAPITTPPTGVLIDQGANATVPASGKIALSVVVSPPEASQTVNWTSGNETIATVSSKGVVTGKAEGSTVIAAATSNGKVATISITVLAVGSKGGYYADGKWTAATDIAAAPTAVTSATGNVIIDIFEASDSSKISLASGFASSAGTITIRDTRTQEEKEADPLTVGIDILRENVTLDGLYFEPENDKVTNTAGGGTPNDSYVVFVQADDTVIKDCTIKFGAADLNGSDQDLVGIMVYGGADL